MAIAGAHSWFVGVNCGLTATSRNKYVFKEAHYANWATANGSLLQPFAVHWTGWLSGHAGKLMVIISIIINYGTYCDWKQKSVFVY